MESSKDSFSALFKLLDDILDVHEDNSKKESAESSQEEHSSFYKDLIDYLCGYSSDGKGFSKEQYEADKESFCKSVRAAVKTLNLKGDDISKYFDLVKNSPVIADILKRSFPSIVNDKEKIIEKLKKEYMIVPVRKSLEISQKIEDNIRDLVKEYMNTKIVPVYMETENPNYTLGEVYDRLMDFGRWVYLK